MISAILTGIFKLIIKLFNAILSPIVGLVTALFPSVSELFSYISSFISQALTYVATVLDLLFVPRGALVLLFDYFAICSAIYLTIISVRFVINVYNKFKL